MMVPRGVVPLAFSGALGGDTFALAALPDSEFEIDLTAISFVSPPGLVALASFVDALGQRAMTPQRFLAPGDPNVRNYMARAHVGDLLDEWGITHNLPTVRERDLGNALVELTQFTGSSEIQSLAAAAFDYAERKRPGSGGPLHVAICEAGENVGFHAGRPIGFAMAQYFPYTGAFEFAIGDAGRGLQGSLEHLGATNDREAIELAIQPGLSATGEPGRGFGLSTIIEQIHGLRGSVSFFTGNAAMTQLTSGSQTRALSGWLAGTIINGRFLADGND